jgi:hypothetical protein
LFVCFVDVIHFCGIREGPQHHAHSMQPLEQMNKVKIIWCLFCFLVSFL